MTFAVADARGVADHLQVAGQEERLADCRPRTVRAGRRPRIKPSVSADIGTSASMVSSGAAAGRGEVPGGDGAEALAEAGNAVGTSESPPPSRGRRGLSRCVAARLQRFVQLEAGHRRPEPDRRPSSCRAIIRAGAM